MLSILEKKGGLMKINFFVCLLCSILGFTIVSCSSIVTSEYEVSNSNSNPAAIYCQKMGYSYNIVPDGKGGQTDTCTMPNHTICDAWDFYTGECGVRFSYCAKIGAETVTATDGKDSFTANYSRCVDNKGANLGSVSELLGIPQIIENCTEENPPEKSNLDQDIYEQFFHTMPSVDSLPASFDWRNNNGNWLTPIKNQGQCGSCWAFAAVGAAESAIKIATSDPLTNPDLAEQYLVSDCHSYSSIQTCCGGSKELALNFIRDIGIPDEACMPYEDGISCSCDGNTCDTNCTYRTFGKCSDTTCTDRCADWDTRLKRIKAAGYLPSDPSTIKTFLVENGPVTASLLMSGYWDGDVYKCNNPIQTNHAVVIVGYNDADKYWIVRNSWGSTWDEDGYFKVGYGQCNIENYIYYTIGITDPGNFYKTSPANNAIVWHGNPTISWTSSLDATQYEYCIFSIDTGYSCTNWVNTGLVTSNVVNGLDPNFTYLWQVRAINKDNKTYANKNTWWSFTTTDLVPINHSPDSEEKVTSSIITFNWTNIPSATYYKIQLALDKYFTDVVVTAKVPISEFKFENSLEYNTKYFWRIKPMFGTVWSIWSPTYKFYSMDPLTAPVLVNPPDAALLDPHITLSWNVAINAVQYKLQVARDAAFTDRVFNGKVNDEFKDFTDLATGKYYWRVKSIEAGGLKSGWSAVRSFTVVKVFPPILYTPENLAEVGSNLTLNWSSSDGAVQYKIQVAKDPAFTKLIVNEKITETSKELSGLSARDYFWRVKAINAEGFKSPWSQVFRFTVVIP